MLVTVEELEAAIKTNLQERQDYLDKANACAGAIRMLQGMLEEAKKLDTTGASVTPVGEAEAKRLLRRLKK
jgi:hypothetical protein